MTRLVCFACLVGLSLVTAPSWLTPGAVHGQELSESPTVPQGDVVLGTVNIPRQVLADGQPLAAGEYTVHLTGEAAGGDTVGALSVLERWVEFRQGEMVQGREVASIVPEAEIADVAKTPAPGAGTARVELLRGNDFIRVWINQAGTHYLLHLMVG